MNLRIELLGRVLYLEWAKTEQPDTEPEPTIADRQYPMTVTTQPLGFRTIGPDEYLEDEQ